MCKHFIKEIEIKSYKLFKDFKAEGFGRVNLIGGKNNVGKTALLEALYLTNTTNFQESLEHIIKARYISDILIDLFREVGKKYIINFINDKVDEIGNIEINTQNNSNMLYKSKNKTTKNLYEAYYSEILKNELEDRVDSYIQEFDSSIEKFRIINSEPHCKKDGVFLNLHELGDGVSSFIFFIIMILANRNSIVLIDEIENGIHYTNLDKLWEIILTISKEQSVQVFATTHSKECIESLARVAKRLNEDEITYTILTRLKNGSIDAGIYDTDMFINTIEQEHEVRGW